MGDYVLQVNYREDEEPVRIPLRGYDPDDAETAHQALESEIERARELGAPVVVPGETGADAVPIDPARVTGVDLLDAEPDGS